MEALPLITNLKKLCNSPKLIKMLESKEEASIPRSLFSFFPSDFDQQQEEEVSGKLMFLSNLLQQIRTQTHGDKIVIVSNYTETLEILAGMCEKKGYHYFRLDGSTKVKKRQQLVDQFNVPTAKECK